MSTLTDGAAITDVNTLVTGYQTDVNAIGVSRIRRGAFNRFHARSIVSVNTPASPKVNSTLASTNYGGGTYTYNSTTWQAMGWSAFDSDDGSDTAGNQNTGNWTIVGHPGASPDAAITAELAFSPALDIGMANSTDPEDGTAGVLVLGNVELRSYTAAGGPDLHLHLCIQVEEASSWHTLESSNRAWAIEDMAGDGSGTTINVDLSVRTLITSAVMTAEAGDTDLTGVRMMIALSNAGSALTGTHDGSNVVLGGFNLTALGLFAGDP